MKVVALVFLKKWNRHRQIQNNKRKDVNNKYNSTKMRIKKGICCGAFIQLWEGLKQHLLFFRAYIPIPVSTTFKLESQTVFVCLERFVQVISDHYASLVCESDRATHQASQDLSNASRISNHNLGHVIVHNILLFHIQSGFRQERDHYTIFVTYFSENQPWVLLLVMLLLCSFRLLSLQSFDSIILRLAYGTFSSFKTGVH